MVDVFSTDDSARPSTGSVVVGSDLVLAMRCLGFGDDDVWECQQCCNVCGLQPVISEHTGWLKERRLQHCLSEVQSCSKAIYPSSDLKKAGSFEQ